MAFSAAEDVRTADSRRHGPKFKNPTGRAGRRDESPDVGMGGPKSLRLKNIYNINCIHESSISPNREHFLILNFFGVRRVPEPDFVSRKNGPFRACARTDDVSGVGDPDT